MSEEEKILDSTRRKGPDPRSIYPIRADVDWKYRDGIIVLKYPKDFNSFERFLNRFIKGPEEIRRPLDDVGTLLWEMSDGEHSLLEIYLRQQNRFHERVEPVDKVVGSLLETFLKLHLMRLEYREDGKKGGYTKSGKRILVRAPKK